MSGLTDDELWRWHAYAYGFRAVALGIREEHSPIDPDGDWYDADLAARAEKFWRYNLGREPKPESAFVRENFEDLHVRDWTAGELALKIRETDEIAKERGYPAGRPGRVMVAKDAMREATRKWKAVFAPRHGRYKPDAPPAREIPSSQFPATPERLRELNARLGYTDEEPPL